MSDASSLCGWEGLPNPKFPILFVGVSGTDLRQGEGASFYNPIECPKVLELIQSLLNSKRVKLTTDDMGVVTPFIRQVRVLRDLLRSKDLGTVRVGKHNYVGVDVELLSMVGVVVVVPCFIITLFFYFYLLICVVLLVAVFPCLNFCTVVSA